MAVENRLYSFFERARRPPLLLAGALAAAASEAFARAPNSVPEPSLLSLIGAAAVAGIIAYRIKNKK
jgi:Ni,Fe-hydrogenase III small subunit